MSEQAENKREGYDTYYANKGVEARYLDKDEQIRTNQGVYTSDGDDVHVIYHDGREDIMAATTFDELYGEDEITEESTEAPKSPVKEVGDNAEKDEGKANLTGTKKTAKRS